MPKGTKRAITAVQILLAALVVIGVGWLAYKLIGYQQAQQIYHNIEAAYASEGDDDSLDIDFAALREQYPDVVAWIKMDDVDISYPIVQGDDNEHYLHYDPSDAPNIAGSVFLDWRNDSLDTDLYSLVYAHNMRDESMFGLLDNYLDEQFLWKGTGTFRIATPKATYKYRIFAVDVVDPSDDIYQLGFNNTQAFNAFVQNIKADSLYDTGVEATGSDHVVTLSTCSSSNRLVISAKRITA